MILELYRRRIARAGPRALQKKSPTKTKQTRECTVNRHVWRKHEHSIIRRFTNVEGIGSIVTDITTVTSHLGRTNKQIIYPALRCSSGVDHDRTIVNQNSYQYVHKFLPNDNDVAFDLLKLKKEITV